MSTAPKGGAVDIDWWITLGSFLVGIVVGLTGMGGGALMTPMLVVFFNVPPLAAVSSDLVASAAMRPVGGAVHLRRGTVNLDLVKWLTIGSVPAAFCGVLIIKAFGSSQAVQDAVALALGIALVLAAVGLAAKSYMNLSSRARRYADGEFVARDSGVLPTMVVRTAPTIAVGAVGGLIVGLTSVGSGSLMIVALLLLYPAITATQLVGTDLVQAVPLVVSAAIGHLLFGDVAWAVTIPLLVGALPGTYLGARISSTAPQGIIRRLLAIMLVISGLKMLGLSNGWLALAVGATLVVGPSLWMLIRMREGLPALGRTEGKIVESRIDTGSTEPLGSGPRSLLLRHPAVTRAEREAAQLAAEEGAET